MMDRAVEMSDDELHRLADLVYERSGIRLNAGKRALVTARLLKRLRERELDSFGAYLDLIAKDRSGQELARLLDTLTTNYTWFFREDQHFTLLQDEVAPWWEGRSRSVLSGWSAACATGEEAFSMVMALHEALPAGKVDAIQVLASDISMTSLETARRGVYPLEHVQRLPLPILRRYFEKGLADQRGLARVREGIRRQVEFRKLNLIETTSLGRTFDFIFCRNVMIYFDKTAQQRVVSMLERHLVAGGYLFLSHAESLNGLTHALRWVAPAVYRSARP